MKLILPVFSIILLGAISQVLWRKEKAHAIFFWPALAVKLMAGIGLGLIYTYYYTAGDTFSYFHDSSTLAHLAKTDFHRYIRFLWSSTENTDTWQQLNFQEPRALFLVKIASIVNLLTGDTYWMLSLYFSFISFLASWSLFKQLSRHIPGSTPAAAIAFLFFPSVVFWSSGLIKESLAMASLFYLSGIFLSVWFRKEIRWPHVPLILLAAWILWSLKYYYGAVFFSIAIATLMFRFLVIPLLRPKSFFTEILLWCSLLIIPVMGIRLLHPNFYNDRLFFVIFENYKAFQAISSPEDVIHFQSMSSGGWSLLQNAPWAFFSGLFRPFIWEAGNLLQGIIGIENLLMLMLALLFLRSLYRVKESANRMLTFACIVYLGALCIFITLSTPNFGTLSRYRVSYIPFFAFLLLNHFPVTRILQSSFRRLVKNTRETLPLQSD